MLLSGGLVMLVFSLLGPQVLSGYAELQKIGLDVYILIDTSKSMLVADLKPDRITIAKKIVETLLQGLEGDRVGFIPFASDAYIQMPLTDDYQLAHMFLSVIDTDMIGGGGTNLTAALKLANASFERTLGSPRVIIVLSDGEEHQSAALQALSKDDSLHIYTIGIGTKKGGLVPVYDSTGSIIVSYMKDENGNPVTSRLSADTLRQLAQNANGAYYQASSQGLDISPLQNELANLQRETRAEEQVRRYQQLYQYFLAVGLLLFTTAWLLPEGGYAL